MGSSLVRHHPSFQKRPLVVGAAIGREEPIFTDAAVRMDGVY